jgi:hypothetical protein
LFAVTINPLLAVGCPTVTGIVADVLIRATFAGLLWLPTTWPGNEIDLGLASSVADSGLGEAVGVASCVSAIAGVALARITTIAAARIAPVLMTRPRSPDRADISNPPGVRKGTAKNREGEV